MVEALKLGILGTASIADRIIEGARKSRNVRVAAVAGRDPARTVPWAARRGIPHAFDSYGELLESGAVDAVYIPLPNSMHAEFTIQALSAGLPVLCEKPAVTTPRDAVAVRKAAVKAGLPVVEGFMYIHHPLYRMVNDIIDKGLIGAVRTIDSRFSWYCDEPESGPALSRLHGGALFDVGCYCVHLARTMAGREPASVMAFMRTGFVDPGTAPGFGSANGVDDLMTGMMDFGHGLIARFETGISMFERHGAEITGTSGAILIDRPWLQDNVPAGITLMNEDGRKILRVEPADTYRAELDAFAAIVHETRRLGHMGPGAEAALNDLCGNAAALFSLFQSARTGLAVEPVLPAGN